MKFYICNLTHAQSKQLHGYVDENDLGMVNYLGTFETRVDVDKKSQKDKIINYIKENLVDPVMITPEHLNGSKVEVI